MTSVTIGIPFFNAAPFLAEAIRSVFAQTHEDWELILLDDGSTDGSLEIAKAVSDARCRVIRNPARLGLPASLNRIAEDAQFDWVARMDADDLMSPERLSRQLAAVSEDEALDVVSTGLFSVGSNMQLKGIRGRDDTEFSVKDLLLGKKRLTHASIIARRAWLRRHPYNTLLRRSQDAELWVRTAAANELSARSLAEPLYIYRESRAITREKLLQGYRNERRVLAPYLTHSVDAARYRARSWAKTAAVVTLSSVHHLERLQAWRNSSPVGAEEVARLQQILRAIWATRVPGLDA